MAFSSHIALETTYLTKCPNLNMAPEKLPTWLPERVPSLSNLCARASTFLSNMSTASTP